MKSALTLKHRAPVGHVDDWLITYADMITLLLCFFVLFLSLTVMNLKKEEAAKPPPPPPPQTAQTAIMEMEPPAIPALVAMPTEEVAPPPAPKSEAKPVFEPKGDRLTTIEMNSAAFFGSGQATLSPAGREILRGVAEKIKGDEYKDYQITVEGHTDDTPIDTPQFPSNWELSTARASAVVQYFLEEGLPAQRLRAAGYADTFPKAPNRDAAGNPLPENQAQNRRVVIKLEKIEKN